jgi:hypothetical protein
VGQRATDIVQVIPAPAGIVAVYATDEGHVFTVPVVCLALIVEDGEHYIRCVEFSDDDGVEDPLGVPAGNRLGFSMGPGTPGDPDWAARAAAYGSGVEAGAVAAATGRPPT